VKSADIEGNRLQRHWFQNYLGETAMTDRRSQTIAAAQQIRANQNYSVDVDRVHAFTLINHD
jgi:hypothetical protein